MFCFICYQFKIIGFAFGMFDSRELFLEGRVSRTTYFSRDSSLSDTLMISWWCLLYIVILFSLNLSIIWWLSLDVIYFRRRRLGSDNIWLLLVYLISCYLCTYQLDWSRRQILNNSYGTFASTQRWLTWDLMEIKIMWVMEPFL